MELLVKRLYFGPDYTIGQLYIDGVRFCDTLEDTVRPFGKNGEGKVYGKTAIPIGRYKIALTFSQRFKRVLCLLLNVPFYEGIRIHGGNTAEDTHGCILLGINSEKGRVTNSQATLERFMKIVENCKEDIYIKIF